MYKRNWSCSTADTVISYFVVLIVWCDGMRPLQFFHHKHVVTYVRGCLRKFRVSVCFFFISAMQRQRPAELAECAPQHICIIISVWALVWHNPIHICTLRACLYFTISAHAVPLHLCSVWYLPCASPPYPQPSLQSAHRRQHRNNKFRGHAIDNWPDK